MLCVYLEKKSCISLVMFVLRPHPSVHCLYLLLSKSTHVLYPQIFFNQIKIGGKKIQRWVQNMENGFAKFSTSEIFNGMWKERVICKVLINPLHFRVQIFCRLSLLKFNILQQFGHPKRRVSFFVSVVAYTFTGGKGKKWSPIFFFKNRFLKYEANMFNIWLL